MEEFIIKIAPICLSAMGGVFFAAGIFALAKKVSIMDDFEKRHFAKKLIKSLNKFEGIFCLIFGLLLFTCAATMVFGDLKKISLAFMSLVIFSAICAVIYIIVWITKRKKI